MFNKQWFIGAAGAVTMGLTGAAQAAPETVLADGSSTVFPVTEAVAEEFQKAKRGEYRVTVGVSGTGGGFKKFCRGDTDISGASRPIKSSERELCAENGIKYIELPLAMDAMAVVRNPKNDWAQCLSVAELKKMWEPAAQGKIDNWNQIRSDFPDRPLNLYGPGVDSGTYDYFTAAIVGEQHASRGDFTASEDDNVLVQGVAGDVNALGFFGFAYFEENRNKLDAIKIKQADGSCAAPSYEGASEGTYKPLARPLFMYVNPERLKAKQSVREFLYDFAFDPSTAPQLVKEVGYAPLSKASYRLARERLDEMHTGTAFADGARIGLSAQEVLELELK